MTDELRYDIHGMTEQDATVFLDSVLRQAPRGTKSVLIVHGYRRGTVLRDLVRFNYVDNVRVAAVELTDNPGETRLILAAR